MVLYIKLKNIGLNPLLLGYEIVFLGECPPQPVPPFQCCGSLPTLSHFLLLFTVFQPTHWVMGLLPPAVGTEWAALGLPLSACLWEGTLGEPVDILAISSIPTIIIQYQNTYILLDSNSC